MSGIFFCGDILQFLKEIFDVNNQMKSSEIDWLYNLISRVFFRLKSTLTVILLLRPHLRSFCLSTQSQDLYTTQLFKFFRIFFLKMILMWKIKSTKKGPVSQNKNMFFFLYFILFFVLLYYYCFFFRLFWNFFSHFAFHSKYKCKNDVIYITVKQNITAAVV